ncbi:MAG TPA: Crp/Fnr family transcriptional regulator [Thermoanaerobaculia bacterium]|nr:Crp/Fnr family transcriptional regulator [Thermoanaerobaculia bacterium]
MTNELAVETHLLESTLFHHQAIGVWPAGRTLFYEGEDPRGVYVIHSGAVDLIFSAKDGRAKTLRVAHTGQILGLSSVFSHRPHDYTATVRSTSDLGYVDEATFHKLLESSPTLLFGVLRLLSEDVNSCYGCMREIALAR